MAFSYVHFFKNCIYFKPIKIIYNHLYQTIMGFYISSHINPESFIDKKYYQLLGNECQNTFLR